MLAKDAQQYTKHVEIPDEYHRHVRVFSEKESHRFPPARSWDHAIHFKPGSPDSLNCKIYPTTPVEKLRYENGLTIWRRRSTSKRRNPIKLILYPRSSSLKRKTGNDDQYKIIQGQISLRSETTILYPLYHPQSPQ